MNLLETKDLRSLDPEDVDKMIAFDAMIVRVSTVIPDVREAFFRCARCSHESSVEIVRGRIAEPKQCANPHCAVGFMGFIFFVIFQIYKQFVRVVF